MRRGCKRILRWAVIGLIIFFCIIPLVIALFQEATGIVVLPTEEALPTVAMLASATNSPEPTETDMATKTMTPTPLPSATASATLTLLSTATFTPTAAHTSTQTAIPTTMPTIDPKADFSTLESAILDIEGVVSALVTANRDDELAYVSLEVVVLDGYRSIDMADKLLQVTSAWMGTALYTWFSAIIDDE